jgi:hypothetical protein
MPQYQLTISFRVEDDKEAKDVRDLMEKMLCDFLRDRPATCIRVDIQEIDSSEQVIRTVQ